MPAGLLVVCVGTADAQEIGARDAVATQHAIDELANACAQRRPECPTATPTPSPTGTPTPTPSPTATVTPEPTATPSPTATPEPCYVADDDGWLVLDAEDNPIPCPAELAEAQVLPPGGPPDNGLAIDPNVPILLEPPPADPEHPDAPVPTPIVVYIYATPAPVPTLGPTYVYVTAPTQPNQAQIIYVLVTPTVAPAPVEQAADDPPPGASLPEPEPTGTPLPAAEPAPVGAHLPDLTPTATSSPEADDHPPIPEDVGENSDNFVGVDQSSDSSTTNEDAESAHRDPIRPVPPPMLA